MRLTSGPEREDRLHPVFFFLFCSTVFSHYLMLMLHRDLIHMSILCSDWAINQDTQRASGTSQVLPSNDFQGTVVSMHSGERTGRVCWVVIWKTFCSSHICINSKGKEIIWPTRSDFLILLVMHINQLPVNMNEMKTSNAALDWKRGLKEILCLDLSFVFISLIAEVKRWDKPLQGN